MLQFCWIQLIQWLIFFFQSICWFSMPSPWPKVVSDPSHQLIAGHHIQKNKKIHPFTNTYRQFRVPANLLLLLAVRRHANRFTTMTFSPAVSLVQIKTSQSTPSPQSWWTICLWLYRQTIKSLSSDKMSQRLVGVSMANPWLSLSSAFGCGLLAVLAENQAVLPENVDGIKQLFILVTHLPGGDRKGNYSERGRPSIQTRRGNGTGTLRATETPTSLMRGEQREDRAAPLTSCSSASN